MSVKHDGQITLIAGEALEPYRRVKYNGSTAGYVVYADAADGNDWIGVTVPGEIGSSIEDGGRVVVMLRSESKTLKCETAAVVTANATLYPEDDGKISDDAGTIPIGQAAGTDTASAGGQIIAFHPEASTDAPVTPDSLGNFDDETDAPALPILLYKRGVTASGKTAISKPSRKIMVVDAFTVLRDATTATDVKVQMSTAGGDNDLCATVALSTADLRTSLNLSDTAGKVVLIPATLNVNLATTCTSPGVDVFVWAIPVD